MSLILSGAELNFVPSVKYLRIRMCVGKSFKSSAWSTKELSRGLIFAQPGLFIPHSEQRIKALINK